MSFYYWKCAWRHLLYSWRLEIRFISNLKISREIIFEDVHAGCSLQPDHRTSSNSHSHFSIWTLRMAATIWRWNFIDWNKNATDPIVWEEINAMLSSMNLNREDCETISNGFWAKFWFFHFNRLIFLTYEGLLLHLLQIYHGFCRCISTTCKRFLLWWMLMSCVKTAETAMYWSNVQTWNLIAKIDERLHGEGTVFRTHQTFVVVKIVLGHYVVFHTEMLFDTYRAISLWCVCDKKSNRTNLDQQNFKSCWHPIFFFYSDLSVMLTFVVLMS